MPTFSRLVRFLAKDGRAYYGDAILGPSTPNLIHVKQAHIITGDVFGRHHVTGTVADIQRLLAPLAPEHVNTVRCLGLNYAKHAREWKSDMKPPEYPILFYKPATALSGPRDPIPVPALVQDAPGLDYEAELVVVIGKRCTNVSEEDALDHVLGYAVGNDVSHREWQMRRCSGGQWSLGKGFDGWAPFGPGIVAAPLIGDPNADGGLRLFTRVNGENVQDGSTRDMIFGVKKTVSFLSQGTTLMPGDLIFTGTPEGVGMARNPQRWLKDGDVVEVGLQGLGTCMNRVEFVGQGGRNRI